MLFEDSELIREWTAYENLDFVLKGTDWKDKAARQARIQEVMSALNLTELSHNQIRTLSGGERQLVAMARSVINRPSIILADEPTGRLDAASTDIILRSLLKLAKTYRTSVVLCTHDVNLLKRYPARKYICRENTLTESPWHMELTP